MLNELHHRLSSKRFCSPLGAGHSPTPFLSFFLSQPTICMKSNFLVAALAVATLAGSLNSCSEEEKTTSAPTKENASFTLAYRVAGTSALADWAIQSFDTTSITQGSVSFQNRGHALPQERTFQIYSTEKGRYLYTLQASKRIITKYDLKTGNYAEVAKLSVEPITGNGTPTWTVLNDSTALVYITTAKYLKDDTGKFLGIKNSLRIGRIDLKRFEIVAAATKELDLPKEVATEELPNLHNAGVESPVVAEGKVYFSVRKIGYDPTKAGRAAAISNEKGFATSVLTLDFPTLKNPRYITSTLAKGSGTYPNVFYGPASFKTENGEIYQTTYAQTKVLRIVNGKFDDSFAIDLGAALNMEQGVSISGIYYAGNQIAYAVFSPANAFLSDGKLQYSPGKGVWGIARIDLKSKTAIKMNTPNDLWLTFYQGAKLVNGKLYMSLCPMTGSGNIYIFDPANASPNGFQKGAVLESAGGAVYLGLF